jgi:flagellar protein FlbD
MIRLTRLNNRPMVVNSELIKFIENAPDTVITLVTGEKIVVLETAEEVMTRIVEYQRRLRGPQVVAPPAENPVEQPAEQPAESEELEAPEDPETSEAPESPEEPEEPSETDE